MIEVLPLFSIPIYINKLEISDKIKKYCNNCEFEPTSNNDGKLSKNKFILNEKIFKKIKKQIYENANIYKSKILEIEDNIELVFKNSWILTHDKNDYAELHHHSNSLISGVLYIKVPENSGDIIFQKPNIFSFEPIIALKYKNYNLHNSSTWTYKTQENLLILFPSNLPHKVQPNLSNQSRISIAFNLFIKGKVTFDNLSDLTV